ncbi:conserved hypothetical protein [Theileria orientalis strain Shintoku]|uniref:Uncharacterized protein n=1 Tax=Theileria orientalis strain Shintoku TaxID=869250 RepID=J7MF05_THEOR|nr:conserved hypothetical protein [Theileria orientalis strain Shintoku]BAM42344.1 conserved hypothetical protein [Theileria orientalis strain Shintoku]|eukprot:XP_009692645.1 conserved hypothetical protein [Theileria orientalis strain Shintoku]
MAKYSHSITNNSLRELTTSLESMCDERYITSNTMKFAILAFLAFWSAKLAAAANAAAAGKVDLKDLKFVAWEGHSSATACPLGTLPDGVFLHKTVDHNGHHYTWVKPVHGLVNEVVCGNHAVWKGAAGELLLDLHFFGKTDADMYVHLEHLTALGGVAHGFLKFAKNALDKPVVLGLAPFVKEVAALFKKEFLGVKRLAAHELLHHLAFHHGLGLKALPDAAAS